jgi:hypothetical protein
VIAVVSESIHLCCSIVIEREMVLMVQQEQQCYSLDSFLNLGLIEPTVSGCKWIVCQYHQFSIKAIEEQVFLTKENHKPVILSIRDREDSVLQ